MRTLSYPTLGACMLGILCVVPAFASATSVTIHALSPGATISAKSTLTFSIISSGFTAATYHVTDSLSLTSFTSGNIGPTGLVSWTPLASDAGTHTLSITVNDSDGNVATSSQAITVLPPPSVTVQGVAASSIIQPGTALSFKVSAPGFTNVAYIAGDSFSGSTVGNSNVDASGNFSWTPDRLQIGNHTITIYGTDSLGHGASASVTVRVGNGPSVAVQAITPSTTVAPGQSVNFTVTATNYTPNAFTLMDSFSGTSISNTNINTSGVFNWTPQGADAGTHVITILGRVGAYGDTASTSVTLTVSGSGGVAQPVVASSTIATTTVSAIASTTPTTAASTTALALLQAQLAALHSQITSLPTQASISARKTFSLFLKLGSKGDEVMQLQIVLKNLGFLDAEPNGNYGSATRAAVLKFQAAHGLGNLGVVGPSTRAALNVLSSAAPSSVVAPAQTTTTTSTYVFEHFMGVGDTDPDVPELQKRLISLGFLKGDATGEYGNKTQAAVKKFQMAQGLRASGYVGPETRAALNK